MLIFNDMVIHEGCMLWMNVLHNTFRTAMHTILLHRMNNSSRLAPARISMMMKAHIIFPFLVLIHYYLMTNMQLMYKTVTYICKITG